MARGRLPGAGGLPPLRLPQRHAADQNHQGRARLTQTRNRLEIYQPTHTPLLSFELEEQVWSEVGRLAKSSLSDYPTTLEQDYELLKRPDLSFNIRNCVTLRVGEKEIFGNYQKMAEELTQLLRLPSKDIRKAAKDMAKDSQKYFEEQILKHLPKE